MTMDKLMIKSMAMKMLLRVARKIMRSLVHEQIRTRRKRMMRTKTVWVSISSLKFKKKKVR